MTLRLPLPRSPFLAAAALGLLGLAVTSSVAPAEAQRWSRPGGGGGGVRVAPPPRGPGIGFRPPPAPGIGGRPAPAPVWRPPPPLLARGWSYRPGPVAPWWGHRPYAWRPGPVWRPWPHRYYGGWYRPWGWWGYGVFVPSITFGLGVVPGYSGYYGYPYYTPYYAYPYTPPYPPPPAYHPPAPGTTCVAGAVVCPLREPAEPGDACNCPTPNGLAWGRVAG